MSKKSQAASNITRDKNNVQVIGLEPRSHTQGDQIQALNHFPVVMVLGYPGT